MNAELQEYTAPPTDNGEFDLNITDITLVHKNRFISGFSYSDYRSGRNGSGIVYCLSGVGEFVYKDETILLHEGECMFLSQSSEYTVRNRSDEPFVHYTANFLFSDIRTEGGSLYSEILSGTRRHKLRNSSTGEILSVFEKLLSAWQAKKNGYRLQSKGLLYTLIYSYLTTVGRETRNENVYSVLRPARKTLDENLSTVYASAELSALCGISEAHFRRLWKKEFGVTPTEYHRKKRLARARDMLLSGVYNVKKAASAVGYDDANYFSRIFRKEFGVPPTVFMK